MNLFLTNPYLFLAVVIWIVCGIVACSKKDSEVLEYAISMNVLIAIFYIILHGK